MRPTFLSGSDVRAFAPMHRIIESLRSALIAKERDEFDQPQRLSLGQRDVLVMPLYHRPTGTSITKTLSLDAERDPFIAGAIVWTGKGDPLPLVADAVAVTTLRTGALSAVAADALSTPEATTMTLYGAGAQAYDQVMAIAAVRPLRKLVIVNRQPARAEGLAYRLRADLADLDVITTADPGTLLRESDIVCCVTTAQQPLFETGDLAPEACVLAVGSYRPDMREVPADLMKAGQPVIVDDIRACIEESGEIIDALHSGRIQRKDLLPLGQVLQSPPRLFGRRLFKTVGIAVEDWAVMQVLSAWRDRANA